MRAYWRERPRLAFLPVRLNKGRKKEKNRPEHGLCTNNGCVFKGSDAEDVYLAPGIRMRWLFKPRTRQKVIFSITILERELPCFIKAISCLLFSSKFFISDTRFGVFGPDVRQF